MDQTVRLRLLGLVALLLLPGLALAGMVTWRSSRTDHAQAENDLRYAAATLGNMVDAEFGRREARLRLLAVTDQLAHGDMAGFRDLAQVTSQFGARVVLRDAADHWVVDTAPAPDHGLYPTPWDIPQSRATVQWTRDAAGLPLALQSVPVWLNGKHAYNLTAFVRQSRLQAELAQLRLAPGWIATLFDTDGRLIASSNGPDWAGPPADGAVRRALAARRDKAGDDTLRDGTAGWFVVGHAPASGVALSIEAPMDRIAQASEVSLLLVVGEGGILVVLGLLGAIVVARSISAPIEALAQAAHGLGQHEVLPPIPGGLVEVAAVARAMRAAHRGLIDRRASLSDMNAALSARVADRTAELAEANRALEEQRARLGLILDHMPFGVLVSHQDGVVMYTNAEAQTLLGFGNGITSADKVPALLRAGQAIPLGDGPSARARRGFTTHREHLAVHRPDGAVLELEVSAGPIYDSDGRVVLSVTTLQDVSERLAAEEARRRSQRLEAVGQLTGGVAHEFNNLLMAIGGCLDLLAPLVRGERARGLLESAARASERGARLTRQLLAFARKSHLQPEAVDLNALVAGLTELLATTLGRSIAVTTILAADTWPAMADATQLELVLLNLAINARDAMPGGGRLTIETGIATLGPPERAEAPPEGAYVMLRVTDTGTGMTPEVLARAFEPFFTTKEVGRGSGLGLPHVLGVAQQLGGGVSVASTLGQGTSLTVYLPRAHETPVPLRRPAMDPPPQHALQGVRVLLVDDDTDVRDITGAMLEEMGAHVIGAAHGEDAMLLLRTQADIDLVLADYTMPGMNGVDLSRRVGEVLPDVPIILMTGYSAAALGDAGPHIKAVLQKPFRAEAMAEALIAVLGGAAYGGSQTAEQGAA